MTLIRMESPNVVHLAALNFQAGQAVCTFYVQKFLKAYFRDFSIDGALYYKTCLVRGLVTRGTTLVLTLYCHLVAGLRTKHVDGIYFRSVALAHLSKIFLDFLSFEVLKDRIDPLSRPEAPLPSTNVCRLM